MAIAEIDSGLLQRTRQAARTRSMHTEHTQQNGWRLHRASTRLGKTLTPSDLDRRRGDLKQSLLKYQRFTHLIRCNVLFTEWKANPALV